MQNHLMYILLGFFFSDEQILNPAVFFEINRITKHLEKLEGKVFLLFYIGFK